jgi:hypothetical protein
MTPSKKQVDVTRAVVEWYRATHYGTDGDVGMIGTFCATSTVGGFASSREALERGDDEELFKLLVTVAMFQRLRDALVMNILRGISAPDAATLTSAKALVELTVKNPCSHTRTNEALLGECDLTKDASGNGHCFAEPALACHLKRHTVLLKRYGHFGKMPTSAALAVAHGGGSLGQLRRDIFASTHDPLDRAQQLAAKLSGIWRVSDKLSAMYLSLVCAPHMGLAIPPWYEGVDWSWFIVVDRNVDLFLESIGYVGPGTYEARRTFVRDIAAKVDLGAIDRAWPAFHPRLVQQSMFLFMSASNRRSTETDCMQRCVCSKCPTVLSRRCPVSNPGGVRPGAPGRLRSDAKGNRAAAP